MTPIDVFGAYCSIWTRFDSLGHEAYRGIQKPPGYTDLPIEAMWQLVMEWRDLVLIDTGLEDWGKRVHL